MIVNEYSGRVAALAVEKAHGVTFFQPQDRKRMVGFLGRNRNDLPGDERGRMVKSGAMIRSRHGSQCTRGRPEREWTDMARHFKKAGRRTNHGHEAIKARQLCKQVMRSLQEAFSGEFEDPVLQDLLIVSVDPAPNAAQLLVTLDDSGVKAGVGRDRIRGKLERVCGFLRAQVADSIHRRKVPQLFFTFAHRGREEDEPMMPVESILSEEENSLQEEVGTKGEEP